MVDDIHVLDAGRLAILGSTWIDEVCFIRARRPGSAAMLTPAVGTQMNFRADDGAPRHCIGHMSPRRNDGAYVDCTNPPQRNERTCVSCAVADAEFARDLHHAHTRATESIDPRVMEHLRQPNVLYLAAFRDGSVKIGTSTAPRRFTRLTEQGAWRAIEAAVAPDGFAVRRLEDLVTTRLDIPQSVAVSRKLKGMADPVSDARLDEVLADTLQHVHDLLESPDGKAAGEADPTSTTWRFPGSDDPAWRGLHAYPSKLTQGTHHIRVTSVCGRLAALERPGSADRFVADLGELFGREIEVGDFEPDPLAVQDSLF